MWILSCFKKPGCITIWIWAYQLEQTIIFYEDCSLKERFARNCHLPVNFPHIWKKKKKWGPIGKSMIYVQLLTATPLTNQTAKHTGDGLKSHCQGFLSKPVLSEGLVRGRIPWRIPSRAASICLGEVMVQSVRWYLWRSQMGTALGLTRLKT